MDNSQKNMMALYLCVTHIDEKYFAGDVRQAKDIAMELTMDITDEHQLGFISSGTRIAYINDSVPASTLLTAQQEITELFRRKLPKGIAIKCFINVDVGKGLIFPLDATDDNSEGNDHTKRWDYSQTKTPNVMKIFNNNSERDAFFKETSDPVAMIVRAELVA
jgi:hypothetical protein